MTRAPVRSLGTAAVPSPSMPAPPWLSGAAEALPTLADAIIRQIRRDVPEFAEDPKGRVQAETRRTVQGALRHFVGMLSTGGRLTDKQAEAFRRIGALEAAAGRSHDTLQAAYRTASQVIVRQLLDWERAYDITGEAIAELSTAVFSFIDEIARLSAEGFTAAQADRADVARLRTRLVGLLVQRDAFSRTAVRACASRLGWPVPEQCSVLEVVNTAGYAAVPAGSGPDEDEIDWLVQAALSEHAISASVGGRQLVVEPAEIDVDRIRQAVATRASGLQVYLGPRLPLAEADESARLAHRAAGSLGELARTAAGGVVACNDHLLELAVDAGRDVVRALARTHLAPLLPLSLAKRVKYGRLLSAWLEFGSVHGQAPGVLDKHRQTLRYQQTQLERMFGAALSDRSDRLGIMLALRLVLPDWEREWDRDCGGEHPAPRRAQHVNRQKFVPGDEIIARVRGRG